MARATAATLPERAATSEHGEMSEPRPSWPVCLVVPAPTGAQPIWASKDPPGAALTMISAFLEGTPL